MYVYHLPYAERMQLCKVLDQNNRWEELAGIYMQYNVDEINEIKRNERPTDCLLTNWGNKNHTVLELFELLHKMKHYQAMLIIKDFIDPIYHSKIVRANLPVNNINKPDNIPQENFNNSEKKISNVTKSVINQMPTKDDNDSVLIPDISKLLVNTEGPKGHVMPVAIVPPQPSHFNNLTPQPHASRSISATDISSVTVSAGAIPQIPYVNLLEATNDWDKRNLLGKGGYGTVFKGKWKNTEVAIKRIEPRQDTEEWDSVQIKQSIIELQCLNAYRHDNILPVYGYSIDGPLPCLIYKYMAGGSLESRLRVRDPTKALRWPKRLEIALGVARGLQFLHTSGEKGLVHADIKSANILLDPCDVPLIGDFGLAREGPHSEYSKVSKVQGTKAYLPAEFLRNKKFSSKVDVYSFGVVLFELATARRVAVKVDTKIVFLKELFDDFNGDVMTLKDPLVEGYDACFRGLIDIGKKCVNEKARLRPEMVEVYKMLEEIQV